MLKMKLSIKNFSVKENLCLRVPDLRKGNYIGTAVVINTLVP